MAFINSFKGLAFFTLTLAVLAFSFGTSVDRIIILVAIAMTAAMNRTNTQNYGALLAFALTALIAGPLFSALGWTAQGSQTLMGAVSAGVLAALTVEVAQKQSNVRNLIVDAAVFTLVLVGIDLFLAASGMLMFGAWQAVTSIVVATLAVYLLRTKTVSEMVPLRTPAQAAS